MASVIKRKSPADRAKEFLDNNVVQPLKFIFRNKAGFIGFCVLVVILLVTFVGPLFVPLDRTARLDRIYATPSWEHPLGTDSEGKDIASQIVHGGRDVLIVAFLTGLITVAIAAPVGATSAFVGGKLDMVVTTITDVILTIPQIQEP